MFKQVALVALLAATTYGSTDDNFDNFGPGAERSPRASNKNVTNATNTTDKTTAPANTTAPAKPTVEELQREADAAFAKCPRSQTAVSIVTAEKESRFDYVGYADFGSWGPSDGHPMQLYNGCELETHSNGTNVGVFNFTDLHVPLPKNTKDPKTVIVWVRTPRTGSCEVNNVASYASQQGYAGLLVLVPDETLITFAHVQSEVTVQTAILDYYQSQTVLTALRTNSSKPATASFRCRPGWNAPTNLPVCTQADIDASVANMTAECENVTRYGMAEFIGNPGKRDGRMAACGCIKDKAPRQTAARNCVLGDDGDAERRMHRNTLLGWSEFCATEYAECPNDDNTAMTALSALAGFASDSCYYARGECHNPTYGATIRDICPCTCETYCDNKPTNTWQHAATDYFGLSADVPVSCEALTAKSPELCNGDPLANGLNNYFPFQCPCTCRKLATSKPCADNDASLAATAASIGQDAVTSCAIAAQFGFCEHEQFGPTVRDMCCKSCPKPCADDDASLAATAASIGQDAVTSCAIAAQFGFCEHEQFGPTVKGMCECACAPKITTEAPFGEANPTSNATAAPATVAPEKKHTVTVTFSLPGNIADMNSTEIQNAKDNIAETFVKGDIVRSDITVTFSAGPPSRRIRFTRRADTILVTVTIKTTAGGFSVEVFKADMKENGRKFTYTIGGVRKTETVKDFTAVLEAPSASATQLSSLTAVFFLAGLAMQFC